MRVLLAQLNGLYVRLSRPPHSERFSANRQRAHCEQWSEPVKAREAVYTNLSPGSYSIGREALINALTHFEGLHFEVEIAYDSRQFRLRIRDDGRGIDPGILEKGGPRRPLGSTRNARTCWQDWCATQTMESSWVWHRGRIAGCRGDSLSIGSHQAQECLVLLGFRGDAPF
jgi:hypothetical protein